MEIERLRSELERAKEQAEEQQKDSMRAQANAQQESDALGAELADARGKLERTEDELAGLQTQYHTEVAALGSAKTELQRAIKLSSQAISCLHEQTDDDGGVRPPPEITAVIEEQDTSIPPDLQESIRSVQNSVTEIKIMQKQIDLAQRKVNEYWKRIQAHEELILTQKKQILVVENRNEKLLNSDPNKRLIKRRNSTSSHKQSDMSITT